jgi:hypothetical protein
MTFYLEHANITVNSIDDTIGFLRTAFPDFEVRGKGESVAEGVTRKWLHIGTDMTYIALEEVSSPDEGNRRPYRDVGINHLGFVVDDVDSITNRLEAAGYQKSIEVEPHPFRKRSYYFDGSGIEYEFVEYLSGDPVERNEYKL